MKGLHMVPAHSPE